MSCIRAPLYLATLLLPALACQGDLTSASTGTGSSSDGSTGTGASSSTTTGSSTSSATQSGSATGSATSSSTSAGACEDGQQCVTDPPSPWIGPVAVAIASEGETPPSCADTYPEDSLVSFADIQAEPMQCTACACGDPEDVECTPPLFTHYQFTNCIDDPARAVALNPAGTCTDVNSFNETVYKVHVSPSLPVDGTGACQPTGGEGPTPPEPTWMTTVVACQLDAETAACASGKGCAPDLPPGFSSSCIYREGDVSCPPGDFSSKSLYFTGFSDTRGCDPCNCTTPGGVSCDTHVEIFEDDACQVPMAGSLVDPESAPCDDVWQKPDSALFVVDGYIGGGCAPGGGQPTGEATPTDPVTFCCVP